MGLLATKKDDSELAEALHLEAVLVLDRLPEVRSWHTSFVFQPDTKATQRENVSCLVVCLSCLFLLPLLVASDGRGCGLLHGWITAEFSLGGYMAVTSPGVASVPRRRLRSVFSSTVTNRRASVASRSFAPNVSCHARLIGHCRLSQEETGASPLITPFGVHCLEKLGDTLLKNGEICMHVSVHFPPSLHAHCIVLELLYQRHPV